MSLGSGLQFYIFLWDGTKRWGNSSCGSTSTTYPQANTEDGYPQVEEVGERSPRPLQNADWESLTMQVAQIVPTHRDGVGAINIRKKYQGCLGTPVEAAMAPPVGIRLETQCCSA